MPGFPRTSRTEGDSATPRMNRSTTRSSRSRPIIASWTTKERSTRGVLRTKPRRPDVYCSEAGDQARPRRLSRLPSSIDGHLGVRVLRRHRLLDRARVVDEPVRRLAGAIRHRRMGRRDLFEPSARHELAVVAGVVLPRLRRVQRVARVARHLADLRARVAERDAQQPGPDPGRDRVHPRSAVEPERRLVHDPALHPFPGEGGQVRLGVRELSPGGHDRPSLPPSPATIALTQTASLCNGEDLLATGRTPIANVCRSKGEIP